MVACRELSRYGSAMLDRAIIVPDASALLRLYECDPEDRRRYLVAFNLMRAHIVVAHRTRQEASRRVTLVKTRNWIAIPHIDRAIQSSFPSICVLQNVVTTTIADLAS
jgi:hypothetical protein